MPTIKQFVAEYKTGYNIAQSENIAEFTQVRDFMSDSKTRVQVMKEFKEEAKTIPLDSARRNLVATINNVQAYYALPDRTVNLAKINYDNLKRVIRLSKYVTTHHDNDMTKLERLGKVYKSDMSGYRYNNMLEVLCKELQEAIKVPPTSSKMTIEQALIQADTMTVEVKTAMLERLLKDLGYSIAEVA